MTNPSLTPEAKRELVKFYRVVSLSDSAVRINASDFTDSETSRITNPKGDGYVFVGLSDDILERMEAEVARGSTIKDALLMASK